MSEKGKRLKKALNTPEYQEYKKNADNRQKRREKTYKFTSIGNSTNTVRNLIILNVVIFFISVMYQSIAQAGALYPSSNPNFEPYQLLTSMFLHGGFIHLGFNMFMLWSFGNQLERVIGQNKFLMVYFISGFVSSIFWLFLGTGPAVGASGALSGLFAAFIFIAPQAEVKLFFVIPMKLKTAFYGFAAFSLIFGLASLVNPSYGFGIGHFAHLGGLVGGYILTYWWKQNKRIPTA